MLGAYYSLTKRLKVVETQLTAMNATDGMIADSHNKVAAVLENTIIMTKETEAAVKELTKMYEILMTTPARSAEPVSRSTRRHEYER